MTQVSSYVNTSDLFLFILFVYFQVNVLKSCFDGFADEDGSIPAENVGNILSMMGLKVKPTALKSIIEEIDEDGKPLVFI